MNEQKEFTPLQFFIRGTTAVVWTLLCGAVILMLPYLVIGVPTFIVWIVGQYRLIELFDILFEELENPYE